MPRLRKVCKCQVVCKDFPNVWTCTSKLDTGRVFTCPYTNKDIKLIGDELAMTHKGLGLGQCQDWEFPTEMWHEWIEV